MQRPLQIGPFDEARQVIFLPGGKFAVILAQFRRNKRQIQRRKNVLLRLAGNAQLRVAGFLLGLEQPIFIQAQPARNRPLAHPNIMFFAAGEIGQRGRKLGVTHHPQITLDPPLQDDAGLRFAPGGDLEDARLGHKKGDHRRRRFGRRQ